MITTAWPVAFSAGRAAELMLYVPRTSISMTVLKPFGERDSPIDAGTDSAVRQGVRVRGVRRVRWVGGRRKDPLATYTCPPRR